MSVESIKNKIAERDGDAEEKAPSLLDQLQSDDITNLVESSSPPGYSMERLATGVWHLIRTTPKLAQCSFQSIAGAMLTCAQSGLYPGQPFNHTWLVPRWNSDRECNEAVFQLGYTGMQELARRTNEVGTIDGGWAYPGEVITERRGTDPCLEIVPRRPRPIDEPVETYWVTVDFLTGARTKFATMDAAEMAAYVDKYAPRNRSKQIVGPWSTNYDTMAVIAVFRSIRNWLPMTTEMATAVQADGQVVLHTSRGGNDPARLVELSAVEDSRPEAPAEESTGEPPLDTPDDQIPPGEPFDVPEPASEPTQNPEPVSAPDQQGEGTETAEEAGDDNDETKASPTSEAADYSAIEMHQVVPWAKQYLEPIGIKTKADGGRETKPNRIKRYAAELSMEPHEVIALIAADQPPPPLETEENR